MIFILVCLIANAIICNGLPQDYCNRDIDADEMVDCDEAGDVFQNPWSYRMRTAQGYAPYSQLSMLKNNNDEGFYENQRMLMNKANNQFRQQSSSYMPEPRNLYQNFVPSRDSLMGLNYQQNLAPEYIRFAKPQMQPFNNPARHYYDSLTAYDEPSYYHPILDYYGGYSPDEYEAESNDDCPSGKCPQTPSEDVKETSGKKLKKNHDKRHNSRKEKIPKITNMGSMIHADEVDEEPTDKDSWGIDRREKQKMKEQVTADDKLKGKRSVEKENIKIFKVKQDDLERIKKDVKQIDGTTNLGENNPLGKQTFIHQIMHIPKKFFK